MEKIKSALIAMVILFTSWILLAGVSKQEVLLGLIVSVLVTVLFYNKLYILADISLKPKSIAFMVIYLFVFLWELIKSNIDVAKRIISPKLPINPGIVKVKTKLKSPLGRAVLANSITLTPGTLTVETNGEFYYIHWIDVKTEDPEQARKEIAGDFEKVLKKIFN